MRKEGTGVNILHSACICSHANDRCTLLFRCRSSRPFSCSLSCKVPTIRYRTTPIAYGVPEIMHARRRTISILATATMAFFLLPVPLHILLNLFRSTGSFLMATQEFSTRVALMNPEPMPVIFPFLVDSPVEYSPGVSPTKPAIFLALAKRVRSSPSSRTSLMAVNHPMPGTLFAISKAFLYRSFRLN